MKPGQFETSDIKKGISFTKLCRIASTRDWKEQEQSCFKMSFNTVFISGNDNNLIPKY